MTSACRVAGGSTAAEVSPSRGLTALLIPKGSKSGEALRRARDVTEGELPVEDLGDAIVMARRQMKR